MVDSAATGRWRRCRFDSRPSVNLDAASERWLSESPGASLSLVAGAGVIMPTMAVPVMVAIVNRTILGICRTIIGRLAIGKLR